MIKFLTGLLIISLFLIPYSARAATINAASCSYADVQAAVNAAQSGDTVLVPAGSCTWNDQIVITKGIYLIGAGIGDTNITSGVTGNYLINYDPASPALNEPFRLSGFSLNLNQKDYGVRLGNRATAGINKIRVDHNRIDGTHSAVSPDLLKIEGTVWGVADNNVFIGGDIGVLGADVAAWINLSYDFGSADNFYFEDNTFISHDVACQVFYGTGGGRYCARYNNITAAAGLWACFDFHGNMGPGNFMATMAVEVYENTIHGQTFSVVLVDARGGKSLSYNNAVTTTNPTFAQRYWEEWNDNLNPPATGPTGQPQHVFDSYTWGNTFNGNRIDAIVPQTVNYSGGEGLVPQANRDFWFQGATFDGTTGVGVGLLSARPTTCTIGVGYWATEESKLYRCNATDVWTLYYTPYTYPHPLRTDCVNYPELCDSGVETCNQYKRLNATTLQACSCNQTDIEAAINAAQSGDTVLVPAGSCIWDNQLVITKGIYLIGAGIGQTVITGNFINNYDGNVLDSGNYILVYWPASPALGEPFRLSGLTFDLDLKSNGVMLYNPTTTYPISKVRVDHVKITRQYPHHNPFVIFGTVYGIMDNCELSNTRMWGQDTDAWVHLAFNYGSANNFYFEDNNFTLGSQRTLSYGEGGTAFCFRHNNITLTAEMFPIFDAHGNAGVNGWLSTMGMEFYQNKINANNNFMSFVDQRGGMALIYNNNLTNVASSTYIQVREEYPDSDNPPANNVISGQPQHVSSSYYWNNIDDGTLVPTSITRTVDYGGEIGPVPQFDRDCWKQVVPFNGTSGVGVGLLSARSATCTVGVGYWANDMNILYKCNSTNTWISYYTPYTYPHPLRTDCVNYPGLCDSGSSAPEPIPGDINGDRLVNINDLSFIGTHFGRTNTHPQWNVTADVVANNEIDVYDVVFVASRFT